MKKTPAPVRALVVVITLALVAFASFKVLIAPQRSKAAELDQEIAIAREQLALAQDGGAPQPDVTPIRVADLFRLSRAMPDKTDIPNVLLQLSAIAGETGVTFQSITPHDPELVNGYRRIPIDLVFQGHFYDLSDFLYRLRNLVGVHAGQLDATGRLFAVQAVSFEEGELRFPQVRATLTVAAYAFGDGLQAGSTVLAQPQVTTEPPAPGPSDTGEEPIPATPEGSGQVGT